MVGRAGTARLRAGKLDPGSDHVTRAPLLPQLQDMRQAE